MLLKIKTPQQIEQERSELCSKAVEILKKQARANVRYSVQLTTIRNKIIALEKQLGIIE